MTDRDGAYVAVGAVTSQCGLGSNPGVDAMFYWVFRWFLCSYLHKYQHKFSKFQHEKSRCIDMSFQISI